jgi:diguanylate cyclase (GGDEF)-like protein
MDERSLRHAVLGLLGVLGVGSAVLASHAVSPPAGFFAITGVAIAGVYLAAALMLGWYAVRRGSARHLVLSITFAFTAGAFALFTVHPHGAGAPWMWAAAHVVLPVGIVLALLDGPRILREAFDAPSTRLRGAAIAAGYVVALLAVLYIAAVRGRLPALGDPTTLVGLGLVIVLISAVAVGIGLRRGRREDLESWLSVVAAANLVSAALIIGAGKPGTLGEMMARLAMLLAGVAMLRAVMADAGQLWNKLGFAGRFAPLDDGSGVLDETEVLAQARLLWPTSPASASLSVVVVAVDGVDDIFDQFGHLTGERVTGEVGRRLRFTLRDADVVGQRGDAAFIVLLPETDVDGARIAVERVLESIRSKSISGVRDSVSVTASAGVAEAQGGDHLDRVLDAAAAALDGARSAGGDRLLILASPTDSHAPPGGENAPGSGVAQQDPGASSLPVAA